MESPEHTAKRVRELATTPAVDTARKIVHDTDEQTLTDQAELTTIPAPPFNETRRARALYERFERAGLTDLTTDEIGNVIAYLPNSAAQRSPVILAAHIDTVFPQETDLTVREEANRILAPGIVDNARGLTTLLALARALTGAQISTRRPLVFIGTVGEEGAGDLRGVKHLFREGSRWREARAFIAVDGTGKNRVVHRAIGSRRLRVTVRGPGGHSWADSGTVNPIHALGAALADFADYAPTAESRSVLSTGRIGGGTSVNAIPEEAWIEIDIRSEDADTLRELEQRVRRSLEEAVTTSNQQRASQTEPLRLEIEVFGDRPSGETPLDSPVVAAAAEATRHVGGTPEFAASSTDANVPIALGVPAITIGAGGTGGGMHTLEEWYENVDGPAGIERVLLTALALAEVA